MPININGIMTITIVIPGCNGRKMTMIFETPENEDPAEVFKLFMEKFGIKATLTDLEAKKGGG